MYRVVVRNPALYAISLIAGMTLIFLSAGFDWSVFIKLGIGVFGGLIGGLGIASFGPKAITPKKTAILVVGCISFAVGFQMSFHLPYKSTRAFVVLLCDLITILCIYLSGVFRSQSSARQKGPFPPPPG